MLEQDTQHPPLASVYTYRHTHTNKINLKSRLAQNLKSSCLQLPSPSLKHHACFFASVLFRVRFLYLLGMIVCITCQLARI